MEQFISNKYTKIYFSIVNRARHRNITEYVERHHIIPRSIGGDNSPDNLVKLTAREHFICHLLLPHMVSNTDYKSKLYHAVGLMRFGNTHQNRTYTSTQYALARKYHAMGNTLSQTGKPMNLSPEERARRAEALKGNRKYRMYSPLSEEVKKNISESKKGKPAPNKGIPAQRLVCPHCNKSVGGANNFIRWHGSNCKQFKQPHA
jgi:hypothetical protein